ncbi:zinc finger protein SNAI2-like [Sinocyclocheilus anshuiensis]|uniref:zinc finger protein SNAI2-like n=1 Tax=Sinocyclocheilus anshuiensis TaxID=1608454 RepID=UPI0007B888E8|nr:PREDICTED: zinc finger protein SNAI2-like [Sinocyclocheilus anshuiensis]
MPRSFLVKKHFNAAKKPNYSELESPTVFISPYVLKTLPVPVIPQPEVLSPVSYNPITVWTTSNLPLSPLPSDLSLISGYPSSLSDTSSNKDHSGSESPRSDGDERIQSTKYFDWTGAHEYARFERSAPPFAPDWKYLLVFCSEALE